MYAQRLYLRAIFSTCRQSITGLILPTAFVTGNKTIM
jgi:hypothetical protein